MRILKILFRRHHETKTQLNRPNTPITSIRRKYILLGSEYSVHISQGDWNSLKIVDETFRVTLREMSRECFEEYIEGWYRRMARKIFQQSVDKYDINGIKPRIKIYKMRRAWARCYYQKGLITFNLHLVKTPIECIDYIALHEMCHFTHHNHSSQFIDALTAADPMWKAKDKMLKDFTRSQATILQKLHI